MYRYIFLCQKSSSYGSSTGAGRWSESPTEHAAPSEPLTLTRAGAQLPEAPAKAHVFLEDLPEDEQDAAGFAKYGAGAAPLRARPACARPGARRA